MKLYSLGHSSLDLDEFIRILTDHGVSWIVDVRSTPFSQRYPQFNRGTLSRALHKAGRKYLFMGDRLGGKPPRSDDNVPQWTQGRINYALVSDLSRSSAWSEGIGFLSRAIRQQARKDLVGCLLCSEADPNNCHRILISFELEQTLPGLSVVHIRPGSEVANVSFQKALFKVSDDTSDYH